jgi:hypothetical protein
MIISIWEKFLFYHHNVLGQLAGAMGCSPHSINLTPLPGAMLDPVRKQNHTPLW